MVGAQSNGLIVDAHGLALDQRIADDACDGQVGKDGLLVVTWLPRITLEVGSACVA